MEAVRSDSQDVRLAAVRALGAVGDDAAVPLLVRLARAKDSIAEAAWQSLEMIIAPGIDQRLLAILRAEKDPAQRAAWIGLLESRRASGAVQAALSEALHPSEEVRRRALEALAALAEPTDVPNMIAMLLKIEAGAERDQAEKAVMAVCQQIADVEQRAQPVIDVLRNVSAPDRKKLLPLLGRIGGAAARQTVREALASKDPELYAAGVRALCNWPDASVADQLSELAQSGAEQGHRMAALRAFIRVVSLPGKPDDQRLSLLKRAMNLAARDDERNLVLQRTAAVTSIEALRFLLPHLDQPALASQACQSVVELARHGELREPNKKEFASALEKVLRTSREPATLEEARRCLGK
jgi:hypothetical protein